MSSEIIRLRQRNQLTLPKQVSVELHLSEGDFLEVATGSEGVLLRPLRLPRYGSPEAEAAERQAEREADEGRVRRFESVQALKEVLALDEEELEELPLIRTALQQAEGDIEEAVRELEEAKRLLAQRMATP